MKKHCTLVVLLGLFTFVILACLSNNKQPEQVTFTATIIQEAESYLQKISLEGLIQHVAEDVTCVSWSPDNRHIAYSEAGNIYIRELSSGEIQAIEIGFWTLSQPVWSPEGNKLGFAGKEREEASRNIWLLDVKTGALEKISNCVGNADECFISAPDWSVHNNRLAYGKSVAEVNSIVEYDPLIHNVLASYPLNAFVGESFAFGSNGIDVGVDALKDTTSSLAWSPDGVYLAIVNNSLPSNVLLLNTQTQEVIDVTQSSTLSVEFDSPIWSADGQWLLLRKLRMEQYDFWEPVGYDFVLTNIASGLSNGEFQFEVIYKSDDPLICPGNLVVK